AWAAAPVMAAQALIRAAKAGDERKIERLVDFPAFRDSLKNGRLESEDERGDTLRGKESVYDLADDWRLGGSLIPNESEVGHRREAFNIMLSMPRGTDPMSVQWAAREFAKAELADHKYVMVLHDHQANPHVHISVRAESKHGRRLNPRKTDLHRWREAFASRLRERGIEAEATRQATRGATRRSLALWQLNADRDGRLVKAPATKATGAAAQASREGAQTAWRAIAAALGNSGDAVDRQLAAAINSYANGMERTGQPARGDVGLDPLMRPSGSDGRSR
ncbi:MAG: relaxase/mobilization nuclease domain-containing protein, partial [Casimicrobiaceae bacterium]